MNIKPSDKKQKVPASRLHNGPNVSAIVFGVGLGLFFVFLQFFSTVLLTNSWLVGHFESDPELSKWIIKEKMARSPFRQENEYICGGHNGGYLSYLYVHIAIGLGVF